MYIQDSTSVLGTCLISPSSRTSVIGNPVPIPDTCTCAHDDTHDDHCSQFLALRPSGGNSTQLVWFPSVLSLAVHDTVVTPVSPHTCTCSFAVGMAQAVDKECLFDPGNNVDKRDASLEKENLLICVQLL